MAHGHNGSRGNRSNTGLSGAGELTPARMTELLRTSETVRKRQVGVTAVESATQAHTPKPARRSVRPQPQAPKRNQEVIAPEAAPATSPSFQTKYAGVNPAAVFGARHKVAEASEPEPPKRRRIVRRVQHPEVEVPAPSEQPTPVVEPTPEKPTEAREMANGIAAVALEVQIENPQLIIPEQAGAPQEVQA